jgi:putative transposase
MPRQARVVLPGVPHHVTTRGNRRQTTFFAPPDYRAFETLLKQFCVASGVEVLAYCLMPNHPHGILTPPTPTSLSKAFGNTKEAYSRIINARHGWQGHLWQGRYYSVPLGPEHLYRAARYVLENPVRAGMVEAPGDWPFSSYRAHRNGRCPRGLVNTTALRDVLADWLVDEAPSLDDADLAEIRKHTRTGRPLCSAELLADWERERGRT